MPHLLKSSIVATPSEKFIAKFKEVFGIDLLDGNWHDRLFSVQAEHYIFQILKFDRWLSRNDPDYNFDETTYKGEPTSLNDYLKVKYGDLGNAMIDYLTQNDDKFESEFQFEGY